MKEMLDIYVRSLAEQEQSADAPGRYQDLGTFVVWLLEQHGFEVCEYPFQRTAGGRKKSTGRRQYGVDLRAIREEAGKTVLYRLVLKRGDMTRTTFAAGVPGGMHDDLWDAARLPRDYDQPFLPYGVEVDQVVVIAVHNGDVRQSEIGPQFRAALGQIGQKGSIDRIEHWDADALVRMAIGPIQLEEPVDELDDTLFPPYVRPFVQRALASLIPSTTSENIVADTDFDYAALSQLIEVELPLAGLERGRALRKRKPGARLSAGPEMRPDRLLRQLAELGLFCSILQSECNRNSRDLSPPVLLPVFDSIERILSRAMEHIRRLNDGNWMGRKRLVKRWLRLLLEQYVSLAKDLSERLETIADLPYGLAVPSFPGETVNYPIRTLRLSSYLAIGASAAQQLDSGLTAQKQDFPVQVDACSGACGTRTRAEHSDR
jgi:hypothetical protein